MIIKFILLSVVTLMLTGCLTSNIPAPTLYVLNPQDKDAKPQSHFPVSIMIERPSLASGLNTDRIALIKNNGRELDYFAEARWNGQLDRIIQDFFIESFEGDYDIIEVDSSSRHQKADYLLVTKVRDFQAEYGDSVSSPPKIKVTIISSILRLPGKEPLNRVIKTKEKQLQVNSMQEIIHGFEDLLQQSSSEILAEISQRL